MIKLFRNVRRNLMNEGKTANYLKYAIGEIILVVIGILLALQVNNWNEARKDRAKEKVILKALNKDFQKNLDNFLPIKQFQFNTFNNGEIVLRNIDKLHMPQSRDSVMKRATGMFGGYPYHPSSGVVKSLISTGDINLIRNDTLKNYLVSWNDILTNYLEFVAIDREFWSERIEPYVIQHGDFLHLDDIKNKKLLVDTVFVNMLVRKQFFNKNIVNTIQGNDGLEFYIREIVRLSKIDSND